MPAEVPEDHNLHLQILTLSTHSFFMAAEPSNYLAVLKASYDYEPQDDAPDEIGIKENQLLFLLERTDSE